MIRQYDIVKIIRKVIEDLVLTVKVKASVDNGDGTFTIQTCNTQYLNDCSRFSFGGNNYVSQGVVVNESVKLKGSPLLTDDFTLPAPLFIPDTPKGTNVDIKGRDTDLSRFPLIWLLEDFPTNFDFGGGTKANGRVKLFFLNVSTDGEWLEGTHRSQCIDPMYNLCDAFLIDIEKKVSGKLERFTTKNRIRFGKFIDGKANERKIIDENLSGVELDIEIPFKKWAVGCDDC